jgi:hypothetical protein
MTDLMNVTKYHNKGYKGQGVKCAIIDSNWNGWSTLKDQGIVKDNHHALSSVEYGIELADNYLAPGHGVGMVQAFHEMAPETEIYLYDGMLFQTDDINAALNYFRKEGISLISCSLNTVNCDSFYGYGKTFLRGQDSLSLRFDSYVGSSITVCVIAGNYANYTSFFHLVKDPGSNNMLFPNGTRGLDIKVVKLPLNIVITRSGYQRVVNYEYVLINTRTGNVIENGDNCPEFKNIAVAGGQANVGDNLTLNIIRHIDDTVDDLNIIIGQFSGNFKLQNPAEMNNESSLCLEGASKKAITTGAILVSDYNKRDVISSMSGRGPIPQDVDALGNIVVPYTIKPELCAPSEGGTTSPTAPRVAGTLAVLASAGLCNLSKPEETKKYLLANHVVNIQPSPNNSFGYGRLFLDAKTDWPPHPSPTLPPVEEEDEDIVLGPNPVSLSNSNGLRIANIPLSVAKFDARIYNVTGELVKGFSILELVDDIHKKYLKWDLRNQNGDKVAPGVYFITIKTSLTKNQIKKIAVKK